MEETLSLRNKKASKFELRIHEIDFLRGICIILVLLDHFMLNLYSNAYQWLNLTHNPIFSEIYKATTYYYSFGCIRDIVRYIVLFGFSFLSGVSAEFSKNTVRRSLILIVIWFIIFVVTSGAQMIGMNAGFVINPIDFNIIGVIALCYVLFSLVRKRSNKVMYAIILICFYVWWCLIPFLDIAYPDLKSRMYFPFFWDPGDCGRPQSDWMPLFPYLMYFFVGVMFSKFFYKNKKSYFNRYEFVRPICFMGRHSLIIYLVSALGYVAIFAIVDAIIRAQPW